jgi:hypothetical protein
MVTTNKKLTNNQTNDFSELDKELLDKKKPPKKDKPPQEPNRPRSTSLAENTLKIDERKNNRKRFYMKMTQTCKDEGLLNKINKKLD